jgi:hypothetical protein
MGISGNLDKNFKWKMETLVTSISWRWCGIKPARRPSDIVSLDLMSNIKIKLDNITTVSFK